MIKFEFTLDDDEAENLMGCIDGEIFNCHDRIQDAIVDNKPEVASWLKARVVYLNELKAKMTNVRVEE